MYLNKYDTNILYKVIYIKLFKHKHICNIFLNKYYINILYKINIDLKIVCFLFTIKSYKRIYIIRN